MITDPLAAYGIGTPRLAASWETVPRSANEPANLPLMSVPGLPAPLFTADQPLALALDPETGRMLAIYRFHAGVLTLASVQSVPALVDDRV